MSLQSAAQPEKISLLSQYAAISAVRRRKERKSPDVVPILADDPYARGQEAIQNAKGEWICQVRKQVEIYASRKHPIVGMLNRGWIDRAMFLGACDYAGIYERAMSLSVRGIDHAAPVVSGGGGGDAVDAVAEAVGRLSRIEGRLKRRHGEVAVEFAREVLGGGATIERAARRRGASGNAAGHWGWLLRQAMQDLAEICGYAVRNAYRNRQREDDRKERQRLRAEKQDRERKKRGKDRQRNAT